MEVTLVIGFFYLFCNTSVNAIKKNNWSSFQIKYQWTFINFTWENEAVYKKALSSKRYIPQNNAIAGIKFYEDKFYVAMPRMCNGAAATLGYFSINNNAPKINPLISPLPNWKTNDLTDHTCDKLESVQSMEIDTNGIMWVLDGHRTTPTAKCPAKLVLYDLKNNFELVHSFTFSEEICLTKGGYLNDIVIDNTDGVFAYITDHSSIDPGLIIYSKAKNKAWKVRDPSMFGQLSASTFVVDGVVSDTPATIDGIALSPLNPSSSRNVYYCAVASLNLYSLSTDILKNKTLCAGDKWRVNVTLHEKKQAQSDGLVIDNKGKMYYTLLPLYGVGKWNTDEPIFKSEIVYSNNKTMIWVDSFCFDLRGNLYLLSDNIDKFLYSHCSSFKAISDHVMFRIFKHFTGTKSYLYK